MTTLRIRPAHWPVYIVTVGLLAAGGALIGLVAAHAGILPAMVLALLPLGALAVISRPGVGAAIVPLALPIGAASVPGVGISAADFSVVAATSMMASACLVGGTWPFRLASELKWAAWFVAWVAAAAMVAPDVMLGIRQTVVLLAGVLFTTVTASAASRHDAHQLLLLFLAVGGGICALSLRSVSQFDARYGGALVLGRAQSIFAQPNDFGIFSAIVLFVALGAFLGASRHRARMLIGFAAVTAATGLVLSLSRGAWLGSIAGLAGFLVLVPEARRRVVPIAIGLAAVFAVLALAAPSRVPVDVVADRVGSVFDANPNPYDSRPAIWREGVRQITERPLLGNGPGGFLASLSSSDASGTTGSALHAHSVPLTVGAEAGLPALVLLAGFTLAVATRVRRSLRIETERATRAAVAGASCALLAVVGQGLVDFTLRNPMLLAPCWLLVSIVLVLTRPATVESPAA